MTRPRHAVVLYLVLSAACTADDKSGVALLAPASARDGGSVYDAGPDHRAQWRAPGDGCDPNVANFSGTCTAQDYVFYVACVNDACGDTFATCAEPCSGFTACIEHCACEDRRCTEACATSAACQDCELAHPCSPDCDAELPACSFEPQYSCEDLRACCATFDSDERRANCEMWLAIANDAARPEDLCVTSFESLGCVGRL